MKRTKKEQLFILIMLFIFVLGLLCISGCGESSCETPKCSSEDYSNGSYMGVSVPGVGGCISSGEGCNSCFYAQSHKFIFIKNEDSCLGCTTRESSLIGCDTRYYDDAQQEKSSYLGCINYKDREDEITGIFYGCSSCDERVIGCGGGCVGCLETGGVGENFIRSVEFIQGIE